MSDEVYDLSYDFNWLIKPYFSIMVFVDQEFGSLFFQISKVINNRCIGVGFNLGSRKASSTLNFSLFSGLGLVLRPFMLIQFGFVDSIESLLEGGHLLFVLSGFLSSLCSCLGFGFCSVEHDNSHLGSHG